MEDRSPYQQKAYKVYFCEKDRKRLEDSEVDKNLFLLVEVKQIIKKRKN